MTTTKQLKEEMINQEFVPKDKKLFSILKSVAYHGEGDSYDAISAYKEIKSLINTTWNAALEQGKETMLAINNLDATDSLEYQVGWKDCQMDCVDALSELRIK